MFVFNKVPLLRIFLPFLAGIIAAAYLQQPVFFFRILLLVLFMCVLVFTISFRLSSNYSYRAIYGLLITLFFLFAGYEYTISRTHKFYQDHFSQNSDKGNLLLAEITEHLSSKKNSYKTILKVNAILKGDTIKPASGKLLAYIKKTESSAKLEYGDKLLIPARYVQMENPKNPEEFNYKRFMSFHQVYHQSYLSSGNWVRVEEGSDFSVYRFAGKIRNSLLSSFRENNITGNEFAVLSALMLGYKDALDADMIRSYSSSGAMHVLAVSGLHVGIIYIMILYALHFCEKLKHGKWIRLILIILSLWFYAMLTGLSPSVSRAATMLSFVAFGQVINRNSGIYNTLIVSAFLLLVIQPYMIMEVGFQLSYLAVIGIVYIQPKISGLINLDGFSGITYRLLKGIWDITSVSVAAQVATFPLGLLYFHQFPNYFIFSNLIVIPLATVIIYAGVILLLLSPFPVISNLCAVVLKFFLSFLNNSVAYIEQLPYSLLGGISINVGETWLIYLSIIFFFLFLDYAYLKFLRFSLAGIIALLIIQAGEKKMQLEQRSITLYSLNQNTAIDFTDGTANYFVADSGLYNNTDKMLFHINHNWWEKGITDERVIDINSNYKNEKLYKNSKLISFYNTTLLLADSTLNYLPDFENIKINILVLCNNNRINVNNLKKMKNFETIIIAADYDRRNKYGLQRDLKKNKIAYIDLAEKGFWKMDLTEVTD